MRNLLRGFTLLLIVVSCSAVTAWADDLDVHLGGSCIFGPQQCNFDAGDGGHPASGWATFDNTPWSLTFKTAVPEKWFEDDTGYGATFGPGGTFQMTGPDNLTFNGQVTSGIATDSFETGYSHVDLLFDGYWSNTYYAQGEVFMSIDPDFGPQVTLDVTTVPEPMSLALLGSGMVGAFTAGRRRLFSRFRK